MNVPWGELSVARSLANLSNTLTKLRHKVIILWLVLMADLGTVARQSAHRIGHIYTIHWPDSDCHSLPHSLLESETD